jgi:hypothetical protein
MGLTLLSACGNSYGELCAVSIQCTGGNDLDVDACAARSAGDEDVALAYDCADPYFKLTDCVDRTATCNDKHFQANCKAESEALNKCIDAASGQ